MENWLQRLRRWIKRLFRPKRIRKHPTVLKRWYGDYCAILRIERLTPGAIATYRVVPVRGDYDILLTLDYLPELEAELLGSVGGTVIKLRALDDPVKPHSHRFAVWIVWRNGNTNPINIWDCDLQGACLNFSLREIAPKRAMLGVALRSLQIKPTPVENWQSQIERMNWLGLLEERIRGELQLPNHNIKASAILQAKNRAL